MSGGRWVRAAGADATRAGLLWRRRRRFSRLSSEHICVSFAPTPGCCFTGADSSRPNSTRLRLKERSGIWP